MSDRQGSGQHAAQRKIDDRTKKAICAAVFQYTNKSATVVTQLSHRRFVAVYCDTCGLIVFQTSKTSVNAVHTAMKSRLFCTAFARHLVLWCCLFVWIHLVRAEQTAGSTPDSVLEWVPKQQNVTAAPRLPTVSAEFVVTNRAAQPVAVFSVQTSCGCATVKLPRSPWIIEPGQREAIVVTIDVVGRKGELIKTVQVDSTAGVQTLRVNITLPPPDAAARQRDREIAMRDRQAVFRGNCAECHARQKPTMYSVALYEISCAICHASQSRAADVPDLYAIAQKRPAAEHWLKWIREGRAGSLMPAFAQNAGGPLTDVQIETLVKFLREQSPVDP